jgi:hypothetical protein
MLIEDTLFLLNSDAKEHHVKAISVKLEPSFSAIPKDREDHKKYVRDLKEKLARAHGVRPKDIIIIIIILHVLAAGCVDVIYTIRHICVALLNNLPDLIKSQIPEFINLSLHASFLVLNLNSASFTPEWNRDFHIDSNCPVNEKRRDIVLPAEGLHAIWAEGQREVRQGQRHLARIVERHRRVGDGGPRYIG